MFLYILPWVNILILLYISNFEMKTIIKKEDKPERKSSAPLPPLSKDLELKGILEVIWSNPCLMKHLNYFEHVASLWKSWMKENMPLHETASPLVDNSYCQEIPQSIWPKSISLWFQLIGCGIALQDNRDQTHSLLFTHLFLAKLLYRMNFSDSSFQSEMLQFCRAEVETYTSILFQGLMLQSSQ